MFTKYSTVDSVTLKPKKEIIGSLTGIKFFLCVLVILSNMMLYVDVNPGFAQHLYIGSFASFITVTFRVDVFFMITGFLLVHLYTEKFSGGIEWKKYKNFLIVRIARLYPLYLFVLFLVLVMYKLGIWSDLMKTVPYADSSERVVMPWSWLYNLTLTTAWGLTDGKTAWNGPAWSISAEFFNYLTFPFYIYIISRLKHWRTQLYSLLTICCLYAFLQQHFIQDYIIDHGYGALVRANFGLLTGALVHGLYAHLKPTKGVIWDKIFLLNLGIVVGMMAIEGYEILIIPKIIYMVFLVSLVLCLSLVSGSVNRFLTHPVSMFLGKLSFGMYLLHQPVIRLMRYFFEDYYLAIEADNFVVIVSNILAIYAVIIFLSYLAHIFIETPARYKLREKMGIKTVEVRL